MSNVKQLKSAGHIAFKGDYEYFIDGCGNLFMANRSNVIDINTKYRVSARFEAPAHLTEWRLKDLGLKSKLSGSCVYLSEEGSHWSQDDVIRAANKSGLPLKIKKGNIDTSGGMRKSTTITLTPKTVSEDTYDDFSDLASSVNGKKKRGPKAPTVNVRERGTDYASFRVIHSMDS